MHIIFYSARCSTEVIHCNILQLSNIFWNILFAATPTLIITYNYATLHHTFPCNETTYHLHLKFSDSKTWQEAWCSNWSSSHRKLVQKEQRKMRPPWSHTWRSHSAHIASCRGQLQACVVRQRRPWHTHASQKSQIAPCKEQFHNITLLFSSTRIMRIYPPLHIRIFLRYSLIFTSAKGKGPLKN